VQRGAVSVNDEELVFQTITKKLSPGEARTEILYLYSAAFFDNVLELHGVCARGQCISPMIHDNVVALVDFVVSLCSSSICNVLMIIK
jgi:hypothetical protein